MPHEPGCQSALILVCGKSGGFLCGGDPGGRVDAAIIGHAPEIAYGTVVVQIFNADGFQKEAVLAEFGIAAEIGRDGAFQSCFRGEREVQITGVFRILHCKTAVCINKLQMFQYSIVLLCCFFYMINVSLLYRGIDLTGNKNHVKNIRFMTLNLIRNFNSCHESDILLKIIIYQQWQVDYNT